MKTRMERYFDEQEKIARTKKNQELYEDMYNDLPSSNVTVLNNESEIDISKIQELVKNREGYKRVKQYQELVKTSTIEEEQEEYDIYEDIDNKIYDINMILEEAKSKREMPEREKYRNLKNTQYNILSKLDLDKEIEEDEMATDFFTQDKTMKSLIEAINTKKDDVENEVETKTKTSVDLFEDLKGNENTILTEAIKDDKKVVDTTDVGETFYTGHLNFTKEDFEGFQNLQTTITKNNSLIKALITILTVILIAIVAFVAFTML